MNHARGVCFTLGANGNRFGRTANTTKTRQDLPKSLLVRKMFGVKIQWVESDLPYVFNALVALQGRYLHQE